LKDSQLLEFRHYDELLTGILSNVYHSLESNRGFPARWRMARRATRLHTVLLDIAELTERADNSIKFLSDMFAARLLLRNRPRGHRLERRVSSGLE